jgi:hypothetical protein
MESTIENGTPQHQQKRRKQWTTIKGENAWTMFKVMAEFVDGFEKLNSIGPCVSIFGSARTKPDHPNYKKATVSLRAADLASWKRATKAQKFMAAHPLV